LKLLVLSVIRCACLVSVCSFLFAANVSLTLASYVHICLVFMKIHWKRALVINTRDYIILSVSTTVTIPFLKKKKTLAFLKIFFLLPPSCLSQSALCWGGRYHWNLSLSIYLSLYLRSHRPVCVYVCQSVCIKGSFPSLLYLTHKLISPFGGDKSCVGYFWNLLFCVKQKVHKIRKQSIRWGQKLW